MHRSMMQIYVKGSKDAVGFYEKALGAEVLAVHMNEDKTAVMHAELNVHGQILALSELQENEAVTGNTMQLCLHFGEGKEALVKQIYDTLKEGAKIDYPLGPCDWSPSMASLIDKYGVSWCIFV